MSDQQADGLSSGMARRSRDEAGRPRAAMIGLGIVVLLVAGLMAERLVIVRPGAAQMIVVSRGGTVTGVYGPGDVGLINPWTQVRVTYDMALAVSDRSAPDRGMPAVSSEGHGLTVFGTAFWREGKEDDLRWRFAHIRDRDGGKTDLMQPLMAAAVQAVMGRTPIEQAVQNMPALQVAVTEELRQQARALLRLDVERFAVTRLDLGEGFRAVVAEREMGRARAASIAASPALSSPAAMELEMIRRWDGKGVIPETVDRRDAPARVRTSAAP